MILSTGLRHIPIGTDDFREIRDKKSYFVDKSELISDIISKDAKVYLFTRPRRFGKSLNLSMLDAFFNQDYKGNTWFDGLKISDHREADEHKNAYPVIYLNMKCVSSLSYDDFISDIRVVIYDAYRNILKPQDRYAIPEPLRTDYLERSVNDFDKGMLKVSINKLCEMTEIRYGRKPIILIDEYDYPINYAYSEPDYKEIMSFLREFYSSTLKTNNHLSFAILTGVMQIAKESMFSGINNLYVNNIFSCDSGERYGFTTSEVKDLCTYYGHPEKYEEARKWYDGYRFGNAEVYNPWSLMNYIDSGFKPDAYWAGTSINGIIGDLVNRSEQRSYADLQALAENTPICKTLSPKVSLSDLSDDPSALFSIMAAAGYLNAIPKDNMHIISIPNLEMRTEFYKIISKKLHHDASIAFDDLFKGMIKGDTDRMKNGIETVLQENIPFILLSKEKDYELIIATASLCMLGNYRIKLELEIGNGRADIIFYPKHIGIPNMVLELKKTDSDNPESLEKLSKEAVEQIRKKRYFAGMKGRTLLYGICFHGKESAISMEELPL